MATVTDQIELTEYAQPQVDLQENMESFVSNATWRELLVELVDTNKLDPWNIDLIKVVDGYVGIVKKMKVMDLHVPANIILAASILLRMKSETLRVFEIEEQLPEPEETVTIGRVIPEVQPLVARTRLQPSKHVTLMELMNALDDVIKLKDKRETLLKTAIEPIQFYIDKEDIDEKIENTYKMLQSHVDKTGLTTFAYLANQFNHQENILLNLFIPLLFLAHKGRVSVTQEKFFDEIFIKINGSGDGRPASK